MSIYYFRNDNVFPNTLHIEPSNRCNSACVFCPSRKITRPRGFMNLDLAKKIIDEAVTHREFKNIIWYGLADPFTDEGIFEKIRYAKGKGVKNMHVSTNGGLLDAQKAQELLDSGITDINFSLDGNSKKSYEGIRRGLSFERTCENVTRFLEMRKKKGSCMPRVSLRTAYTETTKGEIESYVRRWRNLADQINIASVANWAGHSDYDNRRSLTGQIPCSRLWSVGHICWDGHVSFCTFDVNCTIDLGNVNERNFYEIFNVKRMQDIRKIHQEHRFSEIPLCEKCDECRLGENRDARFVSTSDGKTVSLERHNPEDYAEIKKCLTANLDYIIPV